MNPFLPAGAIAVLGLAALPHPARAQASTGAARVAVTVDDSRMPQGFSIVLVLGDLQGGATQDNVPPAARKALSDMKDFLPYKSYRLLDVQWTLCCGGRETAPVVSRLRGPDGRDFELTLGASFVPASRLGVRFALRDPVEAASEAGGSDLIRQLELEAVRLELEYEALRRRVQSSYEVGIGKAPDEEPEVLRARQRAADATIKLARERQRKSVGRGLPAKHPDRRVAAASRAIIDTSFTMDVGETVVVGTSRIAGGDKALIALLTAVARSAPAPK